MAHILYNKGYQLQLCRAAKELSVSKSCMLIHDYHCPRHCHCHQCCDPCHCYCHSYDCCCRCCLAKHQLEPLRQQASWPWHSQHQTLALRSSQPLPEWVDILAEQPGSLTVARAADHSAVLTLPVALVCNSSTPLSPELAWLACMIPG